MQKKIRILSLDGGGIRGIISGVILQYIEQQLQKKDNSNLKIGDYFDFVAGTSTGGILACAYLLPNLSTGHAKYGTEEALNIYLKDGNKIFSSNFFEKLIRGKGLFDEKYSEENLENELTSFFKDSTLDTLIKPCLITSYEITSRKAYFFTSLDAKLEPYSNFYLRDVTRATSAAPTYFEPALIQSLTGQEFSLIDGGLFANNPALCAYAEARKIAFSNVLNNEEKPNFPKAKDMMIVSVGTGTEKKPYYFNEFKNAGKISWVQPIIDILMSGNSETVNYQLRQIYNTLSKNDKEDYYRLEPSLREALPSMDNVELSNLNKLEQAGKWYIDENKDMLNDIVDKLISNK